MVLLNFLNFIEMTANMIYFVALGGDFECQCKIHLNIQCPCLFIMISGQLLKCKLMIFRDSDDHEWLSNDCQLSDDYEWLSNDSIVWWLNTERIKRYSMRMRIEKKRVVPRASSLMLAAKKHTLYSALILANRNSYFLTFMSFPLIFSLVALFISNHNCFWGEHC